MTSDSTGRISLSCGHCGSDRFVFPNDPPKDDDVVTCADCGREIGRYGAIQHHAISAGKAEIDKITKKVFGKKPTWKR